MKLTKMFIVVVMVAALLMPSFEAAPAPGKIQAIMKAGKAIVSMLFIYHGLLLCMSVNAVKSRLCP